MERTHAFKNEPCLFNEIKIAAIMILLAFLFACSSGSGGGSNAGANNPPVNEDPPGLPAVLFLSDQETGGGQNELWGVTSDSQGNLTSRRLSWRDQDARVLEFALDPAYGQVVAYVREINQQNDKQQLVTVNIDGSNSAVVADLTLDAGNGMITEWHWAPDSCCIAYRADRDGDGDYELYKVDAAGVDLEVTVYDDYHVQPGFQWSPDGYYVAFRALDNEGGTEVTQLFVWDVDTETLEYETPITQTDPAQVTGVKTLAWQPTLPANYPQSNPYLAYIADDDDEPGEFELYTVAVNQGGNWKDPLLVNDDTGNSVLDFKWHPGSEYIAYRVELTPGAVDHIASYTVEPNGNNNARMSADNYAAGQWVRDDFEWAPGLALYLGYRANERNSNFTELFWAAKNGNGTGGVRVNQLEENIASFQWAPGGVIPSFVYDYIAYRAGNRLKTRPYLGEGGSDDETVISNSVGNFYEWAPLFEGSNPGNTANWEVTTTTRIAYTSGGDLITASPIGTDQVTVSGVDPDEDPASVISAQWSVDARRLVYLAEDTVENVDALYGTQADQSQGEMISGDITANNADGVTDYLPVLFGQ